MKKLISAVLSLTILVLSLASCGPGEGVPFLTSKSKTTAAPNTVMLTFPEGSTVEDIARKLEENRVCPADEFLTVCNTPREGIEIDNPEERVYLLEGYVFPDTYEFYFNSDAQSVFNRFIENYNAKITDEIKAKAQALGYTMDEMLTLASIIQKECDHEPQECAKVSSVFHNRLKNADFPRLQSDVTTFYITKKVAQRVGYVQDVELKNQSEEVQRYLSLYSTYYCKGLPAGPICNPGIKAINAAVNPADTDYVYFLTDEAGENFYYASTLAEHQANGRKAGLF